MLTITDAANDIVTLPVPPPPTPTPSTTGDNTFGHTFLPHTFYSMVSKDKLSVKAVQRDTEGYKYTFCEIQFFLFSLKKK